MVDPLISMRQPARIRVKLLVILAVVIGVLGAGAFVAHKARKRITAERVLAAGKAALQKEDWREACEQLELYLSKYPGDEALLVEYAKANLAVRPLEPRYIAAAIGAYRRLFRLRPGDAETCTQLARLYFGAGEFNEAAYVCRQGLETELDDPEVTLWLGRSLLAQRKGDQATEVLQTLVEKHPDQVDAYILLGSLALQEDSTAATETALAWLDRCVESNPQSAAARTQRARVHRIAHQDEASAREDLEAADALHPDDPSVLLVLAEEWMSWKNPDRAAAELAALEDVSAEALAARYIDPDDFVLQKLISAGKLAMLRQARQDCADVADQALEVLTGRHRLAFLPLAVDYYLAGGRVEAARQAVEEFRRAVASRSEVQSDVTENVALLSAAVANAEGKPYLVIDLLRGLLTGNPDNLPAWKLLWMAYERTGQTRRSRQALETYVTRQPGDGQAALALAGAYRNRDWAKVIRHAREAERALPDSIEATLLRIEAQINTAPEPAGGSTLMRRASAELSSLREAYPKRGEIHVLQAVIADRQGRHEQALTTLSQAIEECDPKLPVAMTLARLHQRAGRLDEAIEACRIAIGHHAELAAPRITLAKLQVAAGRAGEARKTLTEATGQLSGEEEATATYALVRFLLSQDERLAAIELLERIAAERQDDVQPRLSLLTVPEVQSDERRSQELVAEIKGIEGDGGLQWRIEQAKVWLREDNWRQRQQEIIDTLTHCLEADPGWWLPAYLLGGLYESIAREDKAAEMYRRSLDASPSAIPAADGLLRILERQRRFVEAQVILDRVRSSTSTLRTHRVAVAIGQKDYDVAMAELELSVAADPADARSRVLLARLVHDTTGDVDRALKLLDEARAVSSDRLATTRLKAEILRAAGRGDEALALLNEELRVHDDFAAYMLRAKHFAASGEFQRAEEDYKHLTTFEDAASGYHLLGFFYHERGRTGDAIATWEAGLKADPEKASLKFDLIRALLSSDAEPQRRRGRLMLEELLAENPVNPSLLLLRATLLLAENTDTTRRDAKAILERVAQANPRAVLAHRQLIKLALDAGDLDRASEYVTRALGANPDDPDLLLEQANLQRAEKRPAGARALVHAVLLDDPQNIRALNLLTQLDYDSGDLDAADDHNQHVLKLAPHDEIGQVMHAMVLDKKGQADLAVCDLEQFLQSDAGSRAVAARVTLAELLRVKGDLNAAEARLEEAAAIVPNSASIFLGRLQLLLAQKDYDVLATVLAQQRAKRPDDVKGLIAGAQMLIGTGETQHMEHAKSLIEHVLATDPGLAEGHRTLARLAYEEGDIDTMERALRRVLELNSNDIQALNDLAWILVEERHDAQAALEFADRGLLLYPGYTHLLDTRGVVLFTLGRLEDARTDFDKCIELTTAELSPGSERTRAQALFHLARLCAKQENWTEAKATLDLALDINGRLAVFDSAQIAEIQELRQSIPR
jgi:tetratricopeptide (TPR) repeat protein